MKTISISIPKDLQETFDTCARTLGRSLEEVACNYLLSGIDSERKGFYGELETLAWDLRAIGPLKVIAALKGSNTPLKLEDAKTEASASWLACELDDENVIVDLFYLEDQWDIASERYDHFHRALVELGENPSSMGDTLGESACDAA